MIPFNLALNSSISRHCARTRSGGQPIGDGQRLRVVADAEVLVPQRLRRQGHFFEAGATVAGRRVVVEDAADVARLDQRGQEFRRRQFDLAGVLAHLGRDELQAEFGVHVGFGLHRHRHVLGRQGVVVQAQAEFDRPLPQADVVLLTAGEVQDRDGELGVGDDAQVGAHDDRVVPQGQRGDDARLGRPVAGDLHDLRERDERGHDRRGVGTAQDDVDVLGRLPAASQAAAQFGADDAGHRFQLFEQCNAQRERQVVADALPGRVEEADAVQNLGRRLVAEALQAREPAVRARRLQAGDRVDGQVLVDRADLLRADAVDAQHLDQARRDRLPQLFEVRQPAGADERRHLLLDGLADAADLAERAVRDHCFEVARELADGPRGGRVGAGLEVVLALHLQQHADLFERGGHVVGRHRRLTWSVETIRGTAWPRRR